MAMDTSHPPEAAELEAVLGPSAKLWKRLVATMAARKPPIKEVWHFAGEGRGWSLRLMKGERIILYLTPQEGQFMVGVVLGEKAVAAARAADPGPEVLALIDAAPRYAEGRGIRLPVKGARDLKTVESLAAFKLG